MDREQIELPPVLTS